MVLITGGTGWRVRRWARYVVARHGVQSGVGGAGAAPDAPGAAELVAELMPPVRRRRWWPDAVSSGVAVIADISGSASIVGRDPHRRRTRRRGGDVTDTGSGAVVAVQGGRGVAPARVDSRPDVSAFRRAFVDGAGRTSGQANHAAATRF